MSNQYVIDDVVSEPVLFLEDAKLKYFSECSPALSTVAPSVADMGAHSDDDSDDSEKEMEMTGFETGCFEALMAPPVRLGENPQEWVRVSSRLAAVFHNLDEDGDISRDIALREVKAWREVTRRMAKTFEKLSRMEDEDMW